MWKIVSLLLCVALPLAAEELEVRLSTKSPLQPIYLARVQSLGADWKEAEELRSVLAYDLANNGFSSVLAVRDELEDQIDNPREKFDPAVWRREKIPYVVSLKMGQRALSAIVFQIDTGTSKRYPEIPLSGNTEADRHVIHRLADAIQKDLSGSDGVASLRLLYAQRTKNPDPSGEEWLSDIWVCDWDGANARCLTQNGYCVTPAFLPRPFHEGYFYVSYDRGQAKIFRASLSDPKGDVWIDLRGNQILPAVANTGTKLAFITDVAGRPDLFMQNLDRHGNGVGKPRQIFSAPRATQASPTFSPDSKKIAFVSDKDGTPRIYMMDIRDPRSAQRNKPQLISRKNRENTSPAWSPDGTRLAYSARTDGVRQIWVYDIAANEEWQLTIGPENKENPAWAADSLHLVYNTETNDVSELFVINLSQQEPIQITSGLGQKRFSSWETR